MSIKVPILESVQNSTLISNRIYSLEKSFQTSNSFGKQLDES